MAAAKIPEVKLAGFASLLADLVANPSISSPRPEWDESNQKVIQCLESWFLALGFRVDVLEVPGVPGKFNLLATLGEGEHGLVLAGHTDTVPFDESKWTSSPFVLTERSERLYGLGTCDMKGFFAIIVEALRALQGAELKQPLIILATADEESSMSGARAIADAGLLQARAAVIGEPTSIKPVRMHKGIMMESIRVRGKSGHSSNPALGRSALEDMHLVIAELLRFRDALQKRYQHPAFEVSVPTMNLGHIHGGDSPNRICGHCELSFDLRPLPGMNTIEIRLQLEQRLEALCRERGLNLEFNPLVDPIQGFETSADAELVKLCERLSQEPSKAVAFATEAPFLSSMGMETIVMGAGSIDQAHQPDEFLAISQVAPMANILVKLIQNYCVSPKPENTRVL